MDIAALGLSVDSGPLSRAVQELRQVPAAARSAAAGADQVVGAAERMARAMTQSTTAANQNVRALQVVGSASRAVMQQMANSFAGVRDFPTESPIAYGRALDELRAKYNPLFAAGRQYRETLQDINVALKMGAISEKERSEAIARTKAEFVGQVAGINTASAALRGNANALRAVAIQIPDVIQGITMGQSGFQIFTQQGLQTVQVLGMQPGGIGGAFKELSGWVTKFVTPARLAAGGILAIGAAALTAAAQYQSAQRQFQASLFGAGRASGATVGDLNQAASAGASTFGLSISEAREFAATLAQTGKVGVDEIGKIIKVGHDVATVFGVDATEAAGLLAQSFADPVRGAEKLNEHLGFLSARMQSDIASLVAQNRLYEAQRLLLSGVANSVDGASASLSGMAKGWTAVGNAIANAWNALGEWTSRALNMVPPETGQRIKEINTELSDLTQSIVVWEAAKQKGYESNALDEAIVKQKMLREELERLVAQQDKYTQSVKETQANINSLRVSNVAQKYSPEVSQRRAIEDDAKALRAAFEEINRTGGENSELLKRLAMSYGEFATTLNRAEGAAQAFKTEYEKTVASLKLDISAIGAKGPTALGNIAYQRSLLQSGSNSSEAVAKAELDRTLAIKQAQQQILDTQNARLLSARQATETAKMEAAALGKSVGEQEAMRGKLAARQQLEQEALQTYGNRDAYDRAHLASLEKEVEKQAAIKQLLAEQQLKRDVKFQTDTLFMSPGDQQIAAALRNAYGDNKWKSEMDGALARQMRINNALVEAKNAAADFTASMVEGFAKGEDMVDVLERSLASLGSQLIRMGSQNLIGSLFQGIGGNGQQTGGLLGGGLSSMLGLGSLAGPIGGGLALAAGAAISFFSRSKEEADQAAQAAAQAAQQIAEAQKQWASMAGQVSSWMAEWTTGFAGELSNAIESARSQMQQFANAANEAHDPAGVAAVQEAFNKGVVRSIQEAITALQNYGIEQSEVARQIEDVNNKSTDLKNVMIQFGVAAEDAAMIVDTQLNAALERLRNNFLDDLVRKVNELAGGAWINQLTDLVDEVAQLRADAAALGIQTTLIDEYYVRAAQNIINENQLVGSAFDAVAATIGPLGAGLHEFSAAAEEAAQALKRSAAEIASAIQGYQDQLFIATQDTNTLAGALAVFDLQAQRAREAEIALGGQALVALEALQAQQRLNIILDFQRRAAEAERQRLEEERRLREQAAEQARRALEEAQQFLEGAARRISEYISNLLAGSQSPLSPAARLAQAQGDFATQKALALGGDRDALSGITGYAQNIIDAAKAQYGSSADFQTIFNDLIAQLQTLPTQVSPEQFIVDNLTPPLTDITTSVSDQTDAMQTLFANLQSAVNSGSASAIASALLPVFNSIDTNTDNALTFAEMQSALGATYSTGTLRSIFTELDGNGNGILEKSELIKTATTTTGTNTGTTSTNTANMPQMANNISTMNGYSLTTSQATANTVTALGGTSGTNYPATLVNVLSAINSAGYINGGLLDRIRSNLFEQNTNWGDGYATSPAAYLQGQPIAGYAIGGYVDGPSHYYGGRNINVEGGEYVVNKRDTARFRGMLDQINFGHSAPTNDNGVLISRINALIAEMKKNTNVSAAGAEHVRDGVDAIAGALVESARREKLTA